MHGYSNLSDYYTSVSSSQYIHNINVPMILLNAKDDPIIPERFLEIPRNFSSELQRYLPF